MLLRQSTLTLVGISLLVARILIGPVEATETETRPNILLIITDQQHSGMMSCTGNTWLKTPAIDALAKRGVRFDRAYAANPVCVPSRFSLLTGHYPSAVGIRHNGSKHAGTERFVRQSMGHVFKDGGYRTLYGGKVHLPGALRNIKDCGFETVLTGSARTELADRCAAFLREEGDRGKETQRRPFLMVASFINPHDICYMAINAQRREQGLAMIGNVDSKVCEGLLDTVRQSGDLEAFVDHHCPPLPGNFEITRNEPEALRKLIASRAFRPYVREDWDAQAWRLHRWLYCRLTELVDREIGVVLEALDESGMDRNTVVLFTSDHGDMDSAHRMEHKTAFYEEATRIPMIVVEPQATPMGKGRVDRDHLISNGLDVLPTLCDYAQIKPPKGLLGRSVRPLVRGEKLASWRQDLLIENEIGRLVHTGRYKYARYDTGRPNEMLIDLRDDPGETANVHDEPQYAEILGTLRKRLNLHLERNEAVRKAVAGNQPRVE